MSSYGEKEVTEVKRRCIQSPEHEAVQNSPKWEDIPYTAAVQVFSYLRNKDRIKMAQVCRNWHNSFKDPSLWRKRTLVFDGKLDHKHILFTLLFGEHLQNVKLEICHELGNTCEIIAESFENVLENLKTARLRHLEVNDLSFEKFDMFPEQKNIIKRCLKEVFQSQIGLKTLLIASSHFDPSSGTEIIENLATYTGNGLECLNLYDYFIENLPMNDLDIFREKLTKFQNLKHISVYYSYISDEVLRHWAVSLHQKLETMEISASNREPHSHIITEETWRELSTSCPKLKVKFSIFDLPDANQILLLLPPGVPLNHLFMTSDAKNEQDSQLSVTLKHLADCYGDTLQHLYLSFFDIEYSIDHEVAYLIQRCRYQLQTFTFSGKGGIMVPNAIFDLLNDSQSMLSTVEILYFGEKDPQIKKKLKLIDVVLPENYDMDDDFDINEDSSDEDIMM